MLKGAVMRIRSFGIRLALVAAMSVPLTSCQYIDQLEAIRTLKDANTAYARSDYPLAVELYEQVIVNDPSMTVAYFYLGNSYDQQYRPSLRGERENDEFLEKAIDNYITSVDSEHDVLLRSVALQWLVSAYGPDKANDPARSEPVLQHMIGTDPSNPDNYFVLAKLYEDSGLFEEAEEMFHRVRDIRADDPAVYMQIAGFYNRNEDFPSTIDALEQRAALEPDNPEAFYTIGTFYWEKAFRDFLLTEEEELEYVMLGLEQMEKSLQLNADYIEALTYKNILMRMQANLTDDLDEREELIAEADTLRDRAEELNTLRTEGAL